ncbi:MAG TPA: hypothetical protein VL357_07550 [Rariglobus sp.]|jgi:hypothetical protein|nr:hypothetical protein [Rariglobus sp.]
MNITQADLVKATAKLGLTEAQAHELWRHLDSSVSVPDKPKFTAANVIYYVGALIVIGAMGWFMTKAWEDLGGLGIFSIASLYIVFFILGGSFLWKKPALKIPAGLLLTIAVCMVPLATYGIERWTGYWPAPDPGAYTNFHPYINSSWLIMELATIIAGVVALSLWRFPFLVAPIAYGLWFMSMDFADFIYHGRYGEREFISMIFGLGILAATYLLDLKSKLSDLSFWGYLFGLMAFWGGLSSMDSDSELSKFVYCLINLFLIFLSVALRRKAFLVFGALGLLGYLYHLADMVFADSFYFPFVLSLIGLLVIFVGFVFQKNQKRIQDFFAQRILPHISGLVPARVLAE